MQIQLTITVRARAILTNHELRCCPWNVHARLGRGGRGDQIQVPSPPRAGPDRAKWCRTAREQPRFGTQSFRQAKPWATAQVLWLINGPTSDDHDRNLWKYPLPIVLTKWKILVTAGKPSKLPETPPTGLQMASNCLWDYLWGFRGNSQVSEIGQYWAKTLGL